MSAGHIEEEEGQYEEEGEDEEDEERGLARIDEMIESIYDEQKLAEIPKNCANCKELEKKLIKSEFLNK
jgi:hypothetical protein